MMKTETVMNSTKANLTNRSASCGYCRTQRPSADDLPFFLYRGPGSEYASTQCISCGYSVVAHTTENWARGRSLICQNFTSNPDGHEFDSYYCGCRGWD